MAESTLYLYQATKDPHYLEVGKEMVEKLQNFTRVSCGFASISHVMTKALEDRMDSFFLSETLKYLYLLFDPTNIYNKGNYVFTTEGHMFPIREEFQKSRELAKATKVDPPMCELSSKVPHVLELFEQAPEELTSVDANRCVPQGTSVNNLQIQIKGKIYYCSLFNNKLIP